MAVLIAVYKTPKNVAAFNEHYFAKHAPIARKIPGLVAYQVSDGPVGLPMELGGIHLVAILEFDSVEAIQRGLASPEGQATVADLANFADGGVDVMVFNTKEL